MSFLNVECPNCESESAFFNGMYYECPDCEHDWDEQGLNFEDDEDDEDDEEDEYDEDEGI